MINNETYKILGVYEIKGVPDVHLIEVLISVPPSCVDVSSFTQKDDNLPTDSWQVAYDELYLNKEGTRVIGAFGDQDKLSGETETRIVFFMHYLDLSRPLQTPFGDVPLMEPTNMPARLRGKVKYSEP